MASLNILQRKMISAAMVAALIPVPGMATEKLSAEASELEVVHCPLSGNGGQIVDPREAARADATANLGAVMYSVGPIAIVSAIVLTREDANLLRTNREIRALLEKYKETMDYARAKAMEFGEVRSVPKERARVMNEIIAANRLKDDLQYRLITLGVKRVPGTQTTVNKMLKEYVTRVENENPGRVRSLRIRAAGTITGAVVTVAGISIAAMGLDLAEAFSGFGNGQLTQVQESALGGMLECLARQQNQNETPWASEEHIILDKYREVGMSALTGYGN